MLQNVKRNYKWMKSMMCPSIIQILFVNCSSIRGTNHFRMFCYCSDDTSVHATLLRLFCVAVFHFMLKNILNIKTSVVFYYTFMHRETPTAFLHYSYRHNCLYCFNIFQACHNPWPENKSPPSMTLLLLNIHFSNCAQLHFFLPWGHCVIIISTEPAMVSQVFV